MTVNNVAPRTNLGRHSDDLRKYEHYTSAFRACPLHCSVDHDCKDHKVPWMCLCIVAAKDDMYHQQLSFESAASYQIIRSRFSDTCYCRCFVLEDYVRTVYF